MNSRPRSGERSYTGERSYALRDSHKTKPMRFKALLLLLLLTATVHAQRTRYVKNLDYGGKGNKRQFLDLHFPPGAGKPHLVVWIHGGAWRVGDKKQCPILWMTRQNLVVASINYRYSQQARYPAQIHDCKAAIRYLRGNAEKYGYRTERIGVAGSSAGGHLAALLGTTGGVKKLEGKVGKHLKQSSRVQAVIDLFGPTDFLQMDKHAVAGSLIIHDRPRSPESRLIGGPIQKNKKKVAQANPITFVDKSDAPFYIVHGGNDRLVPSHQSVLLEKALKKAGVKVQLTIFQGAGHGGPQFHSRGQKQVMLRFFRKHLQGVVD